MTAPVKLPPGAEELLQAFPAGEPDFEAQANAIEARLQAAPSAASSDELLAPPDLAAEPGEPAAPSRVRAAAAPKSNFAEMARKSLHQKTDDGAQLAKELLAATAQNRRPSAEMVERVKAAGKLAAASSTPLPAASAEPLRPSGVIARAERAAPTALPARTTSRGAIVGLAGAALALAAGFTLLTRSESSESATTAALAREMAAQASAAPALAKPSAVDIPVAKSDGVVTPEAFAAAPAPESAAARSGAALKPIAAGGPVAASRAPAASAQRPASAVVLEEEAEPVAAVEPQAKPAPTPEPDLTPAQGSTGSVPLTPSAGAVSTALSSVRSSAQACLAGQNDAVSAVVTFAADGRVLRVSAGGPSGACIQAALSKARIQPFARDSFSAATTIRPP